MTDINASPSVVYKIILKISSSCFIFYIEKQGKSFDYSVHKSHSHSVFYWGRKKNGLTSVRVKFVVAKAYSTNIPVYKCM